MRVDGVTILVELPSHLRVLAGVERQLTIGVQAPPTQRHLLDALENSYPPLRGTIRDRLTGQRRPLVRFFACGEDCSHDLPDAPLRQAVIDGVEPFIILGAIAGG